MVSRPGEYTMTEALSSDTVVVQVTNAEDGGLTGQVVATAGEMATRLGLPSAPAEAEALAVARDLMLAELTGARLHFRQVTTAAALDLVRAAKARGVHFGRRPMPRPERFSLLQQQWMRGEISARQAAEQLKITHRTFLRCARESTYT